MQHAKIQIKTRITQTTEQIIIIIVKTLELELLTTC